MAFVEEILSHSRPHRVREDVTLPRREQYYTSPVDWRDEVLYFLLVDRFSDGQERKRSVLDRKNIPAARPVGWRWDLWAHSGAERWQGGTLRGVQSKLAYLQELGITTLWLSPVFKQRGHLNTYHGYGVQDFLDVDPHFGTRRDLVALVNAAHKRGMRIILDIIFNHSGSNWIYPDGTEGNRYKPAYKSSPLQYDFGSWLDGEGQPVDTIRVGEDGVWPTELQNADVYTRAGTGDLGKGDLDDPNAEHKRSDFEDLRDFQLTTPGVLTDLARCFKYWIALTDCDGFRIDTLKHVSYEQARNFCGTIKEFAFNLGKENFFLVGEVAGGDYAQTRYLDVLERNLNAALDIGEMRLALNGAAKGIQSPTNYFDGFDGGLAVMGSHRNLGNHHVSILDDHDHVMGEKTRFSSNAPSDHQVVVGVALQMLTLGIPCIYYGTEQAFAGPELTERQWLPEWGKSDRYLRETMFGAEYPRLSGRSGIVGKGIDRALPGFGAFGTVGYHCFDTQHPAYQRIVAIAQLRALFPVLRHGRQYLRPSLSASVFIAAKPGELVGWSRILDDEEALCVVNLNGIATQSAKIQVDANLNPAGSSMTVVLSTEAMVNPQGYNGRLSIGSSVTVQQDANGAAYVDIQNVGPSEVLVLTSKP